ncbi:MAG TPA: pyridoxamine 5'-phosphate oxidase family protein [Burkholderiales bacterium]|nr:pyridoxamine 5'-phosphate oxidase family protein [Burkholderiales bacterium]
MEREAAVKTSRTKLKRLPKRGHYDFDTIARILDEALYCHIGFVENGQPYVMPMAFGRDGDRLYVHGSVAGRTLKTLASGIPLCVTVTHFDGLVFARSGFHSSINYRSVIILGKAVLLQGEEKYRAMDVIIDHLMPGQRPALRATTRKEWNATSILMIPIEEASAKIREGGPKDDADDYSLPVWAGVLPFRLVAEEPVPDANGVSMSLPDHIKDYRRPGAPHRPQ